MLHADSLKRFVPLPYLLQLLQEIDGLRASSGVLPSVLGELYTNALEHGVLGLDSRQKTDAQGFAEYYRERDRRLASLREGFVRIELKVEPIADGGRLTLEVSDSGTGFDIDDVLAHSAAHQSLSGRGLHLVRRLGVRAQWLDDGRRARVEFGW